MTSIFYGPPAIEDAWEDRESAKDKQTRESHAKDICIEDCAKRMSCLERALVLNESEGVWGGMGESERKRFREHLRTEGYDEGEVPEGDEFWAALNAFYRGEERNLRVKMGAAA